MKRIYICILVGLFSLLTVSAQESFSKFSFSGYKVVIIPDDTFRIDIKNGFEAIRNITADNTLELTVKDQTGQVPKDTIYVYTEHIDLLKLHNCELTVDTLFKMDSLTLDMASSFGILNVKADYLSISAAAGSRLSVKGNVIFLNCAVGAGSHVNAKSLVTKQAEVDVMGYSSLVINAERVTKDSIKNASFQNVHKK